MYVELQDLVAEVQFVGMVNQSASEPEGQLAFQESDGTVDESCRNCNKEPLCELQDEGLGILLNNTLYYQTWKINIIALLFMFGSATDTYNKEINITFVAERQTN